MHSIAQIFLKGIVPQKIMSACLINILLVVYFFFVHVNDALIFDSGQWFVVWYKCDQHHGNPAADSFFCRIYCTASNCSITARMLTGAVM